MGGPAAGGEALRIRRIIQEMMFAVLNALPELSRVQHAKAVVGPRPVPPDLPISIQNGIQNRTGKKSAKWCQNGLKIAHLGAHFAHFGHLLG